MCKIVTFLLLQCIFLPIMGFAHGDLDQRILQVTEEIKVSPDSSYLYFKRGKLLFQHEQYNVSLQDLEQSKNLGYESLEQKLLFSRNYFRLENYNSVLTYLDAILSIEDNNVLALKLKGQTLLRQKKYEEAAAAFEKVIDYSIVTFPENYIEASVAWEALHTEVSYKQAIKVIEKGIYKLGDIISLYDRLIEMAILQNEYQYAIDTQLLVLNSISRKESAYFKLSELYELNNNLEKASENLALAKKHFYELPIRIQNTSFMKELLEAIKSKEINYQPNKS